MSHVEYTYLPVKIGTTGKTIKKKVAYRHGTVMSFFSLKDTGFHPTMRDLSHGIFVHPLLDDEEGILPWLRTTELYREQLEALPPLHPGMKMTDVDKWTIWITRFLNDGQELDWTTAPEKFRFLYERCVAAQLEDFYGDFDEKDPQREDELVLALQTLAATITPTATSGTASSTTVASEVETDIAKVLLGLFSPPPTTTTADAMGTKTGAVAAMPSGDKEAMASGDKAGAAMASEDKAGAAMASEDKAGAAMASGDKAIAATASEHKAGAAMASEDKADGDKAIAAMASEDKAGADVVKADVVSPSGTPSVVLAAPKPPRQVRNAVTLYLVDYKKKVLEQLPQESKSDVTAIKKKIKAM
jgi:hypothetical protein